MSALVADQIHKLVKVGTTQGVFTVCRVLQDLAAQKKDRGREGGYQGSDKSTIAEHWHLVGLV